MKIFRDLSDVKLENNTVLTIGNFDGVHLGHYQIINKVKEIGKHYNLPTVLFTFSSHPMKYFGDNILSIQNEKAKIECIRKAGIDNLVLIPFNDEIAHIPPELFIREILVHKLKSQFIVVGYDFKFGKKRKGDFELLNMLSSKLGYTPIKIDKLMIDGETVSSTNIRKYILDGNIKQANKLLGRNFSLTGIVVKGDGIGKLLGFPTANIKTEGVIIPANGVYHTKVYINDRYYNSITSIGVRPTVNKTNELRVETHIFDFDMDIYDEELIVEFIDFIRKEAKFNSFDELKEQIQKDCRAVKDNLLRGNF
jgi:riboflavin kinase/FMN adenylyltransferase